MSDSDTSPKIASKIDNPQDGQKSSFESKLMFSEIIMEYYRNPRQFGTIESPDMKARDTNPSCGDVIEFQALVDRDNIIKDIKFNGKGCAISQAAASMLAETMLGKTVEEAAKFTKDDMLELLGIPISMMRMKCALLGVKVLKVAVYDYLGKEQEDDEK